MVEIKIHALPGAQIPAYHSLGASGADICALLDRELTLRPGETALVPTGIFIEIPEGYEAQIRPRSGLAAEHGVTLLNSPGTVDSDYRGEIRLVVVNLGQASFTIRRGDRIGQMVVARAAAVTLVEVRELPATGRNAGGFGHTGRD